MLAPEDERVYETWSRTNAETYWHRLFQEAAVVVLDDPQTAGLIPHILAFNRCDDESEASGEASGDESGDEKSGSVNAEISTNTTNTKIKKSPRKRPLIVYRSHIQIQAPLIGTAPAPTRLWHYLWRDKLQHADYYVSHPIEESVPESIPRSRLLFLPAS